MRRDIQDPKFWWGLAVSLLPVLMLLWIAYAIDTAVPVKPKAECWHGMRIGSADRC